PLDGTPVMAARDHFLPWIAAFAEAYAADEVQVQRLGDEYILCGGLYPRQSGRDIGHVPWAAVAGVGFRQALGAGYQPPTRPAFRCRRANPAAMRVVHDRPWLDGRRKPDLHARA